jgi:hypothetical protein
MIKNFVFLMGAIGIGAFAVFLVGETAFRLMGPNVSIVPVIYDENVGALNQPGYSDIFSSEGFSHFSINSEGWRDIDRAIKKPEGTYRIAIVGDSYIEALQVERESMITSILENILSSKSSSHSYEVIPFGMSGADAAVALQVLRHKVMKFSPDLVIYAFLDGNDLRDSVRELQNIPFKPYYTFDGKGELRLDASFAEYILRTKRGISRKFHVFARAKSKLYSYSVYRIFPQIKLWLYKPKKDLAPFKNKEKLAKLVKAKPALSGGGFYEDPPKGVYKLAWNITEQLMLEMKSLCESKNIKFMVLGVTSSNQVYFIEDLVPYDVHYPEKRLLRFSERENMGYLPLSQKFYQIHKEQGIIFHGTKENPGGHWNEAGHKYAAKYLEEFLIEKNMLPDQFLN